MSQDFIVLRGNIFASSGYCLEPVTLRKNVACYFVTAGPNGKPKTIELVEGTDGNADTVDSIPLTAYPDQIAAADALKILTGFLAPALAGDERARDAMVIGWRHMLFDALMFENQDQKTQLLIVNNLHGAGRVLDALNRKGGIAFLGEPDYPAMLDEALAA